MPDTVFFYHQVQGIGEYPILLQADFLSGQLPQRMKGGKVRLCRHRPDDLRRLAPRPAYQAVFHKES